MRPNAHVLAVGPEPWLATCRGCGRHVSFPATPLMVEELLAYMTRAEALHAGCLKEVTA